MRGLRCFRIGKCGYDLSMRGGLVGVAALVLTLLVAVPLGGAASGPPIAVQSMTVGASPHSARAHHVRLAITLTYVMQCEYPGAGPLVVTFPSTVKLPKRFAAGSVKLAGKPVAATVSGRNVTVTIPPHAGLLCTTMGPGVVTLVFTPAAKLANPTHAGSYRFTATHTEHTFRARLVVAKSG